MRTFLPLLLLPLMALAAEDYDLQSPARDKENAIKKPAAPAVKNFPENRRPEDIKKGLPVVKPLKNFAAVPEYQWGGSLRYALRTDLADQIEPRLYNHSLVLSYGVQNTLSQIAFAAIMEAGYSSTGERRSEIIVDDEETELFLNDVTLAVSKTIAAAYKSKWDLSLANEFPTSPDAKREDVGSVTGIEASWTIPVLTDKLRFNFTTGVHYIWNRYEYSPTSGDLNKQGGWKGEISARWSVWRGLFASALVGSQLSRYLDSTTDVMYRNSFVAGYTFSPRFTVTLSAGNGTYADQEEVSAWFVDEYRRIVSLGTRFSF